MLVATRAAAEPPTHVTVPVTCQDDADPPHELRLAPGYYLSEDGWDSLDLKVKHLQDQETRLGAENESLRKSARPGWWWWVTGIAAGAAAGYAAGRLF